MDERTHRAGAALQCASLVVRRERDRLRKAVGQLSARRRRDDELETLCGHAVRPRRRMASARSCSDSPSPRASSASEAANCCTAASSDRPAIVCSRASRLSLQVQLVRDEEAGLGVPVCKGSVEGGELS